MTDRRDAQVEAAAHAMFDLEYRLLGPDWVIPEWDESHRSYWVPLASAAISAIAEERQHDHFFINGICSHCGRTFAEVGEKEITSIDVAQIEAGLDAALRYTGPVGCSPAITRELIKNILTAAAKAEEKGWSSSQLETVGRIHNATIERCAQRIYEYMIEVGLRACANDAAAEIRALKIGERQRDI